MGDTLTKTREQWGNVSDLDFLSISELGIEFRRGRLSPVEATRSQLDRIGALNPDLNAFVDVYEDAALAAAKDSEAELRSGNDRGPLHGVPLGLKDLLDVRGYPTTAGSTFLGSEPAGKDATAVRRLRESGAILLGKQAMHEFAADGPFNRRFGRTFNPWDRDRYTGGSSSGSAVAVSTGMSFGALGSDTGGSVRLPACYCGIVGLKPTYGLVPVSGAVSLAWSLDHIGPLTRTVKDSALMLSAIAGADSSDPWSASRPGDDYVEGIGAGISGLRVGVPKAFFFSNLHPDIERALGRAIDRLVDLGGEIVEIDLPAAGGIRDLLFTIQRAEAAAYHGPWFDEHSAEYGPIIRGRIEQGRKDLAVDYALARRMQATIRAETMRIMESVDIVVTPTEPIPPFDPTRMEDPTLPPRVEWTGPYNITGFPAISVPCGIDADGLPIGMQIGGRPFDEKTVLRAVYAYEQAENWKDRRPPAYG